MRVLSLSILVLIILGLFSGAMLASTGMLGPFLVPALILAGFNSGVARGTCLMSELLITLISVIEYRKAKNLDSRVIIAFLPGALIVALAATLSVKFEELFMKLAIGIFEVVIGILMIATAKKSNKPYSKTVCDKATLVILMFTSLLAGFAKGFFGAGWGPLGVGLFIILGIDPRIVIGSSLVIRLILDSVGGITYVSMNLVDYNAVIILTLSGCVVVPLSVKLTTAISGKTLNIIIGATIILLGALVTMTF